jgi:hypothetical protein
LLAELQLRVDDLAHGDWNDEVDEARIPPNPTAMPIFLPSGTCCREKSVP